MNEKLETVRSCFFEGETEREREIRDKQNGTFIGIQISFLFPCGFRPTNDHLGEKQGNCIYVVLGKCLLAQ